MTRLAGLIAIVTGGTQGFGEGIVKRYIEEGARVVNFDLNVPSNDAAQSALVHFKGSVTSEQDWKRAAELAQTTFGGPATVVVNNAGWTYSQKPTLDVTEEEFDRVFEINVKSIFLSFRVMIPVMKQAGGGSFVQISSTAAARPRPKLTWYNATKGAVTTASKAMAVEHAPDNIRINSICPVAGMTPLLSKFAGAAESSGAVTDDQLKLFRSTIPLGRLSEPSDIANAAVFFADPASSFITGTDLAVDGGRSV